MQNIQEQKVSISQEEPILNYLFKKMLRQDPQNQGSDINDQIATIENAANDLLNSGNEDLDLRIEELVKNYDQEELSEMLINFFEDLTDKPLSEREQVAKANVFLRNLGFQIRQKTDGTSEIFLV